ncbi:MAG: Unknown protein [uncultured Sulfurovum sp.]|uniref:Uncharacterized protein n=1 Tax=uncultured Sulfurovum sp. TaxID=269237 RepID=A0A6S6SLV7_9BACT|nr:MAG: Unknown protein [uncultured Sulfurovum sp.]
MILISLSPFSPLNGSKIRLRNEDGNKNAHFTTVAAWLNELLAEDLANGTI